MDMSLRDNRPTSLRLEGPGITFTLDASGAVDVEIDEGQALTPAAAALVAEVRRLGRELGVVGA